MTNRNKIHVNLTNYGRHNVAFSKNTVVSERKCKKEKKLNNKMGAFAFRYDEDYKKEIEKLLTYVLKQGLTVAGYDKGMRIKRSISNVSDGDLITVAVSKNFDVDYEKRSYKESGKLKNIKTYDFERDYYEIQDSFGEIVVEKKRLSRVRRPKNRTYRELFLSSTADVKPVVKRKNKKNPYSSRKSKAPIVNVELLPHFIQIEDEVYASNPNDVYCL